MRSEESGSEISARRPPLFRYFKYADRMRSRYGLLPRAEPERTQVKVSVDEPYRVDTQQHATMSDLRTRIAAVVKFHTSLVFHYSHATPTIACECFGWQGQSGDEGEHDLHVADAVIRELGLYRHPRTAEKLGLTGDGQ